MELTFEQLPQAVAQLISKLDKIERLLLEQNTSPKIEQDHWFDLKELIAYDPEKRSKMTFYGYVRRRDIPFHKTGKKIIFLKSEIDSWLKQGRQKTHSEISLEAEQYLTGTGKSKIKSAS